MTYDLIFSEDAHSECSERHWKLRVKTFSNFLVVGHNQRGPFAPPPHRVKAEKILISINFLVIYFYWIARCLEQRKCRSQRSPEILFPFHTTTRSGGPKLWVKIAANGAPSALPQPYGIPFSATSRSAIIFASPKMGRRAGERCTKRENFESQTTTRNKEFRRFLSLGCHWLTPLSTTTGITEKFGDHCVQSTSSLSLEKLLVTVEDKHLISGEFELFENLKLITWNFYD